jgi:cytochrome c oxidase subunit 1
MAPAKPAQAPHANPAEPGFWRTYVFSTDHKMIGKQYLFLGLAWLGLGGLLALLMRWQLAWPDTPVPGFGWVPEPYMFEGVMGPEFYNMLVTMHGTIMVFFVVMPILIGAFGNFLIPLMIGARDMAFPLLNMLSFWVLALASAVMLASFIVPGGAAASGWTAYAPLSARAVYTGVTWGQDLWILGIALMIVSSTMGGINYVTTIVNIRAPGMTWFRLPFFIWFIFLTAILFLFSAPVLTAAAAMLLIDRQFRTSFFLPGGGGEPLLWQHLFWFFGHPEVYVLVLPAVGAVAEILPVFARKPAFGYRATIYSLLVAGVLSFLVWGHHMFISGMDPGLLATAFTLLTIAISAPFSLIVFNLLATLWGGSIRLTTPMLYALGSLGMFTIGGLSGIFNGSTAIDIYIHDTYFVVGHFHYIIFGAILLGGFAAIAYWFPKMFGRMMNETLGKVHFWLTVIFANLTFFPMHLLGMAGHMRRISNPLQYEYLQPVQPTNVFITISAVALGLTQVLFMINFLWSLFAGKKAERNPWKATTVEWSAPSPPPHGNWGAAIPVVYRGPYEYSLPALAEDYLPQDRRLPSDATAQAH